MTRRVTAILALLLGVVTTALAQPSSAPTGNHLAAGHAALAVHDPTAAIREFEQDKSADGRAWLAVSLMMESRSPSDAYVQRAFEAAVAARAKDPTQAPRLPQIRSEIRPGEVVMAFLVVDHYAYAWAIDRDVVVGYPLPSVDELTTAVTAARDYLERHDEAGLARIGEEIMPALLGPIVDRLQTLQRLVFVLDGPLRGLPVDALPVDAAAAPLGTLIATAALSDYARLIDTRREPPAPRQQDVSGGTRGLVGAVAVGVAIATWLTWRRRQRP